MQWYSSKPKEAGLAQESHVSRQLVMQIPRCTVHLMDEGEAVKIAGPADLTILRVIDNSLTLATIVKVGKEVQWPLTKDEPVVKLDDLHYLFTIPVKGGDPLSLGVAFSKHSKPHLEPLDPFLRHHSCFSSVSGNGDGDVEFDWKDFAPRIEDYNGVLARAIAGGTGQIIRGIFMLSNGYTNQVQRGGDQLILTQVKQDQKPRGIYGMLKPQKPSLNNRPPKRTPQLDMNLKRVRKLSEATENMSKTMLEGLGLASASLMGPLVQSRAGQAFFSMMPGEILLASLDAIDRILNAAEAAEKQTMRATSGVAVRAMEERFGEGAAQATGDVLATAGHVAGAAWNVYKIRKAFTPTSSATAGLVKTTQNVRNYKL